MPRKSTQTEVVKAAAESALDKAAATSPRKQDGQGPSHAGFEGDGGEQQIGACHGDPGGLGVQEKQGAQPEEQQVDEDQDHRKCPC